MQSQMIMMYWRLSWPLHLLKQIIDPYFIWYLAEIFLSSIKIRKKYYTWVFVPPMRCSLGWLWMVYWRFSWPLLPQPLLRNLALPRPPCLDHWKTLFVALQGKHEMLFIPLQNKTWNLNGWFVPLLQGKVIMRILSFEQVFMWWTHNRGNAKFTLSFMNIFWHWELHVQCCQSRVNTTTLLTFLLVTLFCNMNYHNIWPKG